MWGSQSITLKADEGGSVGLQNYNFAANNLKIHPPLNKTFTLKNQYYGSYQIE
jgi:hypothetical protein